MPTTARNSQHQAFVPDPSSRAPDVAYALIPGLPEERARALAGMATSAAQRIAPKLSGASSGRLRPFWSEGAFGVSWSDPYVWYQISGTRGRVMRSLAGKTIPMWLDDPDGRIHRENPKAEQRVAADGRRQVLLFRKAARIGQRKQVRRRVRGRDVITDVPASYPGAPGRIRDPRDERGRITYASRSGGVRWRHPGIAPNSFIQRSIAETARRSGLGSPQIHVGRR